MLETMIKKSNQVWLKICIRKYTKYSYDYEDYNISNKSNIFIAIWTLNIFFFIFSWILLIVNMGGIQMEFCNNNNNWQQHYDDNFVI